MSATTETVLAFPFRFDYNKIMKKVRIYLDNCCLNRPFDDQRQLRVSLETQAKLFIQSLVVKEDIELLWSYMLELENRKNPFANKRLSIASFSSHAVDFVKRSDSVSKKADRFEAQGLKAADAIHLACAGEGGADFLITTDDKVLKFQSGGIQIVDPITFIKIFDHGEAK